MKLYEINEAYQELLNLDLDQESLDMALKSIETELNDKCLNIGYVMKDLESNELVLETEIKRLQDKLKSIKGRKDSLKSFLSETLVNMDVKEVETTLFTFSLRKSESLVVDNQSELPKEYIKVKTTETADKTALKKAIKNGEEIKGCHIETKQNLQVK